MAEKVNQAKAKQNQQPIPGFELQGHMYACIMQERDLW